MCWTVDFGIEGFKGGCKYKSLIGYDEDLFDDFV